jgi:hypothetical protein
MKHLAFSLILAACMLAATSAQGDKSNVNATMVNGVEYTATLEASSLEGETGEPVYVTVRLSPPEAPMGQYISLLPDVVVAPAPPKISSDFPTVAVVCPEPGRYELLLRVNFIEKNSCAGAKPHFIAELPVTLIIR